MEPQKRLKNIFFKNIITVFNKGKPPFYKENDKISILTAKKLTKIK